jgi:hypothetical protein
MRTHHYPLQEEDASHHGENPCKVKEKLAQHQCHVLLDRPFSRRSLSPPVALGFRLINIVRRNLHVRAPSLLWRRGHTSPPQLRLLTHDYRQLRDAGEQLIPVASIVGSVDGASQLFNRSFLPVSKRARARLGSVLVAMCRGEPLPPIEVYAWGGE